MEILFNNEASSNPIVSFVLLDWSCRESPHFLHYINDQSVPREQYEVIWIEYYQKKWSLIEKELKKSTDQQSPPLLDQWIVMGMPEDLYYHKHLMYNLGIIRARGQIVTICDSDAMVRPQFVETIIQFFKENPQGILHMDQVRNNSRNFYPFNYPSFEQIIGKGAINYKNGTTTGILDKTDPLHTRNYGACMAAKRDDIIAIGGADEHIDYLGHVCGPYDMTFRLKNFDRKEAWHPTELLYHAWHPGQAGDNNFMGPHDGMHMSIRALEAIQSGRTSPFKENVAIKKLRLKEKVSKSGLLEAAIDPEYFKIWTEAAVSTLENFYICETTHLVDSFRDFNIVVRNNVYYGLPRFLGPVDLNKEDEQNQAGIVSGNSVPEIKTKIKEALKRSTEVLNPETTRYLKSVGNYNLFQVGDSVFAVPKSFGPLDINDGKTTGNPHIIKDGNLENLISTIKNQRPGPAHYKYPLLRKVLGPSIYTLLSKIKNSIVQNLINLILKII